MDLKLQSERDADELGRAMQLLPLRGKGLSWITNNNARCSIDTPKESLEVQLEDALIALRKAGGRELDLDADEEETDEGHSRYMDELLNVCDLCYELGEYQLASRNYFRCYTIALNWHDISSGRCFVSHC